MKKIHLILALLLTTTVVIATSWTPKSGLVKFQIRNSGITVDGTLSGLRASIDFNPNDLSNSKIYASVNVNTISTGINKRDAHLQEAEYFNASKYPKIIMKSTSFTSTGGNNYSGNFDITIKGKTKSISVPFTFIETSGLGKFSGSLELNRLDFGVGESSWILSDEVSINISLTASKKD